MLSYFLLVDQKVSSFVPLVTVLTFIVVIDLNQALLLLAVRKLVIALLASKTGSFL